MGLWWVLLVAAVWESARGLEEAAGPTNNATSSETVLQPTVLHQKTKRGAVYPEWAYKQVYGFRNTKKTPKFSSWGGKRSSPALESCSNQSCFLDDITFADPNQSDGSEDESAWNAIPDDIEEVEKKSSGRAIYKWALARGFPDGLKRNRFSSWGGKRDDVGGEKRTRFSSWGGKRSKFSSWGGKRSEMNDPEEDKRAKFSSWGGKRNEQYGAVEDKRGRFSSWGGKRNEPDDWNEEKRAKFSSWGGKRNDHDDPIEDKRARFSSWGGKRDEPEAGNEGKRAKFSSWGGKRNEPDDLNEEKRVRFSSWGGKRDGADGLNGEKRAKFSSWGGKRNEPDDLNEEKRAKFSSWGGKRDGAENMEADKRLAFSSWGGKRENADDSSEEEKVAGYPGSSETDDRTFSGSSDEELEYLCNNVKAYKGPAKREPGYFPLWSYGAGWQRKPVFSSWGGKRSAVVDDDLWDLCGRLAAEAEVALPDKRAREAMGGKRRTPFSSWGGKRSHVLAKRSAEASTPTDRSAKKSIIGRYYMKNILLKDGSGWSSALRPIRRGSDFYPWGGKRSLPS